MWGAHTQNGGLLWPGFKLSFSRLQTQRSAIEVYQLTYYPAPGLPYLLYITITFRHYEYADHRFNVFCWRSYTC